MTVFQLEPIADILHTNMYDVLADVEEEEETSEVFVDMADNTCSNMSHNSDIRCQRRRKRDREHYRVRERQRSIKKLWISKLRLVMSELQTYFTPFVRREFLSRYYNCQSTLARLPTTLGNVVNFVGNCTPQVSNFRRLYRGEMGTLQYLCYTSASRRVQELFRGYLARHRNRYVLVVRQLQFKFDHTFTRYLRAPNGKFHNKYMLVLF